VPMVKVPSEQFKCGIIITPVTGFLVPVWSPILVPFLVRFGSRISQFYWVFCVPRVVFGPVLDVFWPVLFGTLLPSVRRPHDPHPLRHFGSRVRRTWDRRLFVGFGRDFSFPMIEAACVPCRVCSPLACRTPGNANGITVDIKTGSLTTSQQ
jgi:hypothetical protein